MVGMGSVYKPNLKTGWLLSFSNLLSLPIFEAKVWIVHNKDIGWSGQSGRNKRDTFLTNWQHGSRFGE
jgi:hypothetical protein